MIGRVRRIALLAALLSALLLTGCASKPSEQQTVTPERTVRTVERAEDPVLPTVENNGGHFVRVGDTVYFRRYGADALSKSAVFGEFTEVWGVYGESEIMAYHMKTGELTTLYREAGSGELWFADNGFYLNECTGGRSYVAWYALDGSGVEVVGPGRMVGVTDTGLVAVTCGKWDEDRYRNDYTFYRGRELVGRYSTDENLLEAGLTDDGLFLVSVPYPYADEAAAYGFFQITPQGDKIALGEVAGGEDAYLYEVQADRFLAADGKVVFGIGFYAGTGYFFDNGVFAEATVGQADSLQILDTGLDLSELYEMPYAAPNGAGGFEYVEALSGALRTGRSEDEALELWENGAWQPIAPHFAPERANGWASGDMAQELEYVNGSAYAAVARVCASPADDIGWRAGYALASLRYLRVDRDGTVTELTRVDHNAEMYGFVWFVEGAGVALLQQLSSEDGEGWFAADCAYAFPIADDAYWEDGVFDGVTGLLPYDYGEGEADYLGYPVPDAEPAGELCLMLDGDGTVTALLRKDPDAMLNVDFNVPESALVGAVATIPLERRESDEDTPFFWTLLHVLEDGVRVHVERTPEQVNLIEHIASFNGAFVSGETVYDAVLDCGQTVALRASLPWHPELRVSVSKEGKWGSYVFGEDNHLHLEDENGVHPGLTLAAYPLDNETGYNEESLLNALSGTWLHYGADGTADAALTLDSNGSAWLTCGSGEEQYALTATTGRLYSEEWDVPDLLCLTTEDEALTALLGFGPNVGDYSVELFRTDGEELLYLTQRNNGDGALGALLPDANGDPTYDFVFTRSRGAGERDARRFGMTFPAVLAKYDSDAGLCWLRNAELAESDPMLGDVWRADPAAPCLPYAVSEVAAPEGKYPMCVCTVTTDGEGVITRIEPITTSG